MKRSDMISLILTELSPYFDSTDRYNRGECATSVLKSMEEAGMTPPAVKEPCPTHYIDAMGQVQRGEDSVLFVHRWEDG